jgi:hypothetical protein
MAFNNSKAFYVSSVKYAAITAWAVATAKTVGQIIRAVSPAVNSERVFMCVVAGTTHATTEPTWNTNRGASTTDNASITWLEVTGNAAICADLTNTPNWTLGSKAQSVSLGHIIQNNAGTFLFICTTSGTGHATTEPTWNTTTGATTADNTATFTCIGATSRYGKFEGAAARCQNLWANAFGNSGGPIEPTKAYVGSDHAETQASSINWSSKGSMLEPIDLVCIDVAGNIPPTAAGDLQTTATITTTSSSDLTINGYFRVVYGITFTAGTSGNITLQINNQTEVDRCFESCNLRLGTGTGSSAKMQFGVGVGRNILKDCVFKFANTGQSIYTGGWVQYNNCSVDGAGSIPSIFLQGSSPGSGTMYEFNACDLSALSSSIFVYNNSAQGTNFVTFNDCKVPATFTPVQFNGSNSMTGERVTFNRCSTTTNPLMQMCLERSGTLDSSLTVYRHDGASENSVHYGWRVVQTANTNAGSQVFQCPMIAAMNATIAADVTVTVYGVINAAAVPTDLEAHMEVTYLGSNSHTQGTIKTTRPGIVVTPTNLTADTSDWDDGVTARANTTAYVVGDVRKVASNTGRIFICTTAGTSAGSEPGGYASAVDGGSVTDGSAVFRAGCRFKITKILTSPQPQQAGLIYAAIKLAKASATFYFDPLLELT